MAPARILPFKDPQSTRLRIIDAVGVLLVRVGPERLSSSNIAAEAGVDESLIKRYFGGFGQLLDSYAHSTVFWPDLEELAGGNPASLRGKPLGEVLSTFFRNYLRGVMDRPWTLAVMESESRNEKNLLTHALAYIRERRALEFFEEALEEDTPDHIDLSAVILLMALAVSFLGIRSRSENTLGGVDLRTTEGWSRIEDTIDFLLVRSIDAHNKL